MHLIPAAVQRIFRRSARRRRQTHHACRMHDLRGEQLEDRRLLSRTVGLLVDKPGSFDGYTLFAPSATTTTYLVDESGVQVHSWQSKYPPMSAYLQENGDLLRVARLPKPILNAAGASGRIERFNWEGDLVWQYTLSNAQRQLHHDIEVMPNGNILMIAWEKKTRAQAIAAGRDAATLPMGQLWPDMVIEVQPTGSAGGNIVWEWHLWDHIVQNRDRNKPNYRSISKNPQLVNVNFTPAGEGEGAGGTPADWTHFNGIDYNPALDQIVLSPREFSEFWIIDHSTTTQQAAGHAGGNSGKGGDLLYRWGNPRTYGRGTRADQQMWYQHDAQWIDPGLPGEGHILVFDNGWNANRHHSSVQEIIPPLNGFNYTLPAGKDYGPAKPHWKYVGSPPRTFFAPIISGAQRLPNGNTLIAEGTKGEFFEVTRQKQVVWRYVNPFIPGGPLAQGSRIPISSFGIAGVLQNLTFRAYRYAPDYPGLAGRDLTWDFYDTVGLYKPAGHTFYLNNKTNGDLDDLKKFVTPPLPASWIPLAGDWDGDGDDTVGVYDPAGHTFYLNDKMVNGTGIGVTKFVTPPLPRSWLPVAGDWDGDGDDTVGLYDPANHTFYLNNEIDGSTDQVVKFVAPVVPRSWKPLAGDWNGDTFDTPGLYNPNGHTFHLYNQSNGGTGVPIRFVTPDIPKWWRPLAGDWNGNGIDSVGVYDQYKHVFYLNNKTDGTTDDVIRFATPAVPAGWLPLAGNWNGSPDESGPDAPAANLLLAGASTPTALSAPRIDINESGRIDFSDFSYFASVFGRQASDPAAPLAETCDFDGSGVVDYGDLAYFSANFMKSPAQGDELVLPRLAAASASPQWPVFSPPDPLPGVTGSLTADQLAPLVAEATKRIVAAQGAQAETALAQVTVQITDLPGSQLGQVASDLVIQVDVDAAGRGWFADLTPGDDLEFLLPAGNHEMTALPGSPAYGNPDLLTVVMHEMGHLLGSGHGDDGVMQAMLPLGTRRAWADLDLATTDYTDLPPDNPAAEFDLDAMDAALAEEFPHLGTSTKRCLTVFHREPTHKLPLCCIGV